MYINNNINVGKPRIQNTELFSEARKLSRVIRIPTIRSDAQRVARQKERREQQLEKHSFNAEIIEDPSLAVSMVSWKLNIRTAEVNQSNCYTSILIIIKENLSKSIRRI